MGGWRWYVQTGIVTICFRCGGNSTGVDEVNDRKVGEGGVHF